MNDDLTYPANDIAMIAEIADGFLWRSRELYFYDSDYITHFQKWHKKNNPKCKMIEIYEKVADSIDNDFGEFTGKLHSFLAKIYHNHKRIQIFLKTEPEIYTAISKTTGLLECVLSQSEESFFIFVALLGYYGDIQIMESIREYTGMPKKHFKKKEELTLDDYKEALRMISIFLLFLERHKTFRSELEIAYGQLLAYCKAELGENWFNHKLNKYLESLEKENKEKSVSIRTFLITYCDCKSLAPDRLEHWRVCLNDANNKKTIVLPKPVNNDWKPGKALQYIDKELTLNWPSYCKQISSLPPLK